MPPILSSIVIINWNTADLLVQCIQSVYDYPPTGGFEIWVVDNHSHDDSIALVRQRFPGLKVIQNTENVGFATANNQAIRQAAGPYLILLNPDTILDPNALTNLVGFMDDRTEAGAAGPYLLNPDRTLQESCYPIPTLGRELWRLFHLDAVLPFGRYAMETWPADRTRPVGAVKGACLILRQSALDEVGLFDEDYFMYTEEIDLCYRLQKAGWPTFWVPGAKVVHLAGQSTKKSADAMFLALYRSKLMFFRKHHGPSAAILYKAILMGASISRLAYLRISGVLRPKEQARLKNLTNHYRELVHQIHGM